MTPQEFAAIISAIVTLSTSVSVIFTWFRTRVNKPLDKLKKDLMVKLEIIEKQNNEQTEDLQLVKRASMRSLGAQIKAIYDKNYDTKTLTEIESGIIDNLYPDYKELKGNGHVQHMYEEMRTWEIRH